MKMKQVADKLGKHDNTVRNWSEWYSEFLSPAPPKGESRQFTDEDLRVLVFVNDLSDKGLNRAAIHDALKQKFDANSPFPPVSPDMLISKEANQETALALQEAQSLVAQKEAEIQQLTATVTELREQIKYMRTLQDHERGLFDKRADDLVDKYMLQLNQIGQKHSGEIARLSHEIGRLHQQVRAAASQDAQHNEEKARLDKIIEDLTQRLDEVTRKVKDDEGKSDSAE